MTAEALLDWRKRLGLTQIKAAEMLGIDRKTMRHYETGKYPIPKYITLAATTVARDIKLQQGAKP